jgi:hypothetical protein
MPSVDAFVALRIELLPLLPYTEPRIAKLAVGRKTYFPFMGAWGGLKVDEWSVFFARRYFMARNPDLAYPFVLLHLHGGASEVSDDDDLWAFKLPKPEAGTPLLRPDVMAAVEAGAPTRKLGRTNRLAAQSLLEDDGGVPPAAEEAAAYLEACGWRAWFNTHAAVVPGDDVFAPPKLPPTLVLALRTSTRGHVVELLEALVESTSSAMDE